MRHARDIMSQPVITVDATTPVTEVARILSDNGISGCPVVDASDRIRGIISRTDLLEFALSVDGGALTPIVRTLVPGLDEAEEEVAYAPIGEDFEVPSAQDLMSPDPVTVQVETPISEVAALMARERVHRVPVMDKDRIVGIITALDLVGTIGATGAGAARG